MCQIFDGIQLWVLGLSYLVPERKLGFFVKIKEDDPPPNFGGLTTPVRSAGPTGQAVIQVVFRGLKFESDADIGEKDSFRSGTI
jgi:hypothetical protein